jgi:hypothetical protein
MEGTDRKEEEETGGKNYGYRIKSFQRKLEE